LDLVLETGEAGSAADLHRIHGDVLLARAAAVKRSPGPGPRIAAAAATDVEACLTRALSLARTQHAKSWELRAALSLARLYQWQHRAADALRLVSPLLEWFTEGRDTADVQAARAFVVSV
jgi:predicted ATPase